MSSILNDFVVLNNGIHMPIIGLGTHTIKGWKMIQTVKHAHRAGYMAYDTAWLYKNERSLRYALKWNGIKRSDVFITSKLEWKQLVKGASVEKCLNGSLKRLGTDYLDLYLVHWPKPIYYLKIWEGISNLYKAGRIKAIGVSSFTEDHLERIKEVSDIVPAVNQIELHPLNNRRELVNFCQARGIQIVAHSPFARGSAAVELMKNPTLESIASSHNKSVAQIILRWIVQQGFVTIPRSTNPGRIKDNISVFDFALSIEEMELIDSLNQDKYFGGDPRKTTK
jgi:diketogulonate reductase-like aldo/keto reductase